jgi:predicted dehydrogenase
VTADDTASFLVRLSSGAPGMVQVSQVAHGRQNYRRIEVFGNAGSAAMIEDRTISPHVQYAKPGDSAFETQPTPADLDVAFDDFPLFHVSRIIAALRGESDEWPSFEDGFKAQRIVAAVEESQRTGHWVSV